MSVVYEFDGFRLDPQRRRFADARGEPVPLAPRTFDALHFLIQKHGELVDKAALRRAIWPRVVVGDNSLDQIISRLRRALTERGASESCIRTERGRGYRFCADVRSVEVPGWTTDPAFRSERGVGPNGARALRLATQACTLSTRPSPDNLRAAFELLDAALALDPRCAQALAYRGLLRTVSTAFEFPVHDALAAAEQDIRQALESDPRLAYGHHGLGNLAAARGEWNAAATHYEAAAGLELEPHARVSRIYQLRQAVGHLGSSFAEAQAVDRSSSSQPLGAIAAALASLLLERNSEALEHAERACVLGWPRANPVSQDIHFLVSIRSRRIEANVAEGIASGLGRAMREAGAARVVRSLCAALTDARSRDLAVRELHSLLGRVPEDDLGVIDRRRVLLWFTMLGAIDDAFEFADVSLDYALKAGGTIGLLCARGTFWLPEMRPFRRNPRFAQIVARLRFVEHWQVHGPPDDPFPTTTTDRGRRPAA